MGLYDGWLFPPVLDLVMQQKQMVLAQAKLAEPPSRFESDRFMPNAQPSLAALLCCAR
jgi:hypothetical protein